MQCPCGQPGVHPHVLDNRPTYLCQQCHLRLQAISQPQPLPLPLPVPGPPPGYRPPTAAAPPAPVAMPMPAPAPRSNIEDYAAGAGVIGYKASIMSSIDSSLPNRILPTDGSIPVAPSDANVEHTPIVSADRRRQMEQQVDALLRRGPAPVQPPAGFGPPA